jgi:hypothetical protein
MGTVYEAEDSQFGRHVALKLIAPGFITSRDAVDRFRQEGRLAGTIAHPRCVFVIGADEEAGRPYIVMELMPGTTLQDLVKEQGPLGVRDAVAKILDVIEGLKEAHRVGVIHRDVKPSNCFIDTDGRVKVGDFGLSKSLEGDAHLTRTGAFLGTPLYASPEQIRRDPLDVRTDVYSVAATLYYLLTGHAPFDQGDAAATMARIVADSPPSIRDQRPEIPRVLDRIVLKGLERNRDRRWRNLDELYAALRPFVEDWGSVRGLGQRFAAQSIDFVLSIVLAGFASLGMVASGLKNQTALYFFNVLSLYLYFLLMEGLLGFTVGKLAMRIRVRDASGAAVPGLGRAFVRTTCYFLAFLVLPAFWPLFHSSFRVNELFYQVGFIRIGAAIYIGALFLTARPSNGYRGVHELLSGTRVVRQLSRASHSAADIARRPRRQAQVVTPKGIPAMLGAFTIEGAMVWDTKRKVLLGHDPSLNRPVWIVWRERSAPALPAARVELSRPSRQRWIIGGETPTNRWDAFAATEGCLLADLIVAEGARAGHVERGRRGLSWADARPILEQIAEELAAACRDGTLPPDLTPDSIWLPVHGHVQLLDATMGGLDTRAPETAEGDAASRAMTLLQEVAILALEGLRRPVGSPPRGIRAPVPLHARPILDRLLGVTEPYPSLDAFLQDLESTRDRPAEIHRPLRFVHMGLFLAEFGAKVLLSLAGLTVVRVLLQLRTHTWDEVVFPRSLKVWELAIAILVPWTAWAFFTRGGYGLDFLGIALARPSGRPVSRFTYAWREACVWIPIILWAVLHDVFEAEGVPSRWVNPATFVLIGLTPLLYAAHAILVPGRLFQDRLAGTHLVPK